MKINFMQQNSCFKSNQYQNKTKIAFKGIEEVIKEEGDQWTPNINGVAKLERTVSYHPFLDEKVSEYEQRINKTHNSYCNMGIYKRLIATKTLLGEALPVTKEESKRIPYDILQSMASRLKKSVGILVGKQEVNPVSADALHNIGKRIKI